MVWNHTGLEKPHFLKIYETNRYKIENKLFIYSRYVDYKAGEYSTHIALTFYL